MIQWRLALLITTFLLLIQHGWGQTDSLYKIALKKADAAYDFKWWKDKDDPADTPKFETAKKLYSIALQINPAETYLVNRLKEIEKILYDFKTKPIYQKLISQADYFLNLDNYVQAKKYYVLADSLYSTVYTKEKLSAVSALSNLANSPSDSIYSIAHGTSFGMCYGYCFNETKFTKDLIIHISKSWEKEQPDKYDTLKTDRNNWAAMVKEINMKAFYKLLHTIGSPDGIDEGAEWLTIETKGNVWKVEFSYMTDIPSIKNLLTLIRQQK